jgi:hypothetical protein
MSDDPITPPQQERDSAAIPLDAKGIVGVLRRRHGYPTNGMTRRYAFFAEARLGTGWGSRIEYCLDENGEQITELVPNLIYDPAAPSGNRNGSTGAWVPDGTFRTQPKHRPREHVANYVDTRLDAWALDTWKCQKTKRYYNATTFEVKVSRGDFLAEIKNPTKRLPGLEVSNYFTFVTPRGLLKASEIPPECGLWEVNAIGHVKIVVPPPFRERQPLPEHFLAACLRRGAVEIEKEDAENAVV